MITGYVSSDEGSEDDYYFAPVTPCTEKENLPIIQNEKIKEKLHLTLSLTEKYNLFLEAISNEDFEVMESLISMG